MSSGARERLREKAPTRKPARVTAPEEQLSSDGGDSGALHARDVLGLQRRAGNQAVARMLTQVHQRQIQRVPISGVNVESEGGFPSWTWGGTAYHLNMRNPGSFHITEEMARTHYYFTAEQVHKRGLWVTEISDLGGVGHLVKGMGKKKGGKGEHKETRKRFSDLQPAALRQWFEANYDHIIRV